MHSPMYCYPTICYNLELKNTLLEQRATFPGENPNFSRQHNQRTIPGLQGLPMKFQVFQSAYEPYILVITFTLPNKTTQTK